MHTERNDKRKGRRRGDGLSFIQIISGTWAQSCSRLPRHGPGLCPSRPELKVPTERSTQKQKSCDLRGVRKVRLL